MCLAVSKHSMVMISRSAECSDSRPREVIDGGLVAEKDLLLLFWRELLTLVSRESKIGMRRESISQTLQIPAVVVVRVAMNLLPVSRIFFCGHRRTS